MEKEPWVLVAGGFHRNGGMDKANLALAEHLVTEGHRIHLVSYKVSPHLCHNPLVTVHLVRRPFGSFMLADPLLSLTGLATAKKVKSQNSSARVLTNGGNCPWNDINWAHCVHSAWPCCHLDAPWWFRVKNRVSKKIAVLSENRAFRSARVVIANSERTRCDLINKIGIDAQTIHTVYLGTESDWTPATNAQRHSAKNKLGLEKEKPIAAFVGALGLDDNKGFDTLWTSWQSLCREPSWDAHLVVAGAGNGLPRWKVRTSEAGLGGRITFLGFTTEIAGLLAGADLLVSPVRYEAYGLNVQEAISRGVPAIVSSSAGIAERFPHNLNRFLLPHPENIEELIERLRIWRANVELWKHWFQPFSSQLRNYTWRAMAQDFVSTVADVN